MKKTVLLALLAMPLHAALAQRTGVSHPDEVPVTTSAEGIVQPVVFETSQGVPANMPQDISRTPQQSVTPGPAPDETYVATPAKPSAAIAADPSRSRDDASNPTLKRHSADDVRDAESKPLLNAAAVDAKAIERNPIDPDADIVHPLDLPPNRLPPGTLIKAHLREGLSTVDTAIGTTFSAELREPFEREGRVILPVGTVISGRVTDMHSGRRISGRASIHLQPTKVIMPDGTIYPLRAQVADTSLHHALSVDAEGTILRRDQVLKTVAELGLATGGGAAAGGVIAGPPGALVGGAVGAGVGTALWLKQDRQADLPNGSGVTFVVTETLTIGIE